MMDSKELARFVAKTETQPDGCVFWTGAKATGYGRFSLRGKLRQAHVVAWEHVNGPVPDGMDVDHECHNRDHQCKGGSTCRHRACVNEEHLAPRTRAQNIKAHFERVTHCPAGHPYDERNTLTTREGHRQCRTCSNRRTITTRKGRKTHCPQGHEYTEDNTIVTRNARRMCRTCAAAKAAQMRASIR